ncbi:MAG TPA: hypothetical protein VMT10_11430 [Solirubrobacteraceae bacterium]|nr:hypothetical protein [Solirubrobacteraceae bacterium]
MTDTEALFRFVQLELPWALGPADGRYVVRGHAGEPAFILVLRTLGAPQRRLLGRRRTRAAAPEPPPAPVLTARATLVAARPLEGPGERWLAGADLEVEADRAVGVLNAVLHAHRIAAADPSVRPVTRAQALVVRVGVGAGEQVADGRWARAVEVPPARARGRRESVLRPQERLAAILGARDVALACEDLALRAREDADAGRWREAAFQLRVALEAAIAELQPWSGQGDLEARIAALREQRQAVGRIANAALEGGLDDEQIARADAVLGQVEAALRARTQVAMG